MAWTVSIEFTTKEAEERFCLVESKSKKHEFRTGDGSIVKDIDFQSIFKKFIESCGLIRT